MGEEAKAQVKTYPAGLARAGRHIHAAPHTRFWSDDLKSLMVRRKRVRHVPSGYASQRPNVLQ